MENFFNQIFSSYEEFNEKFIEWQDANFQLITINKCDKFKQGTDEFKTRFKYERVRFHCHHSGNQKSGKILNATQVGSRNNTHTAKKDCPFKAKIACMFPTDLIRFFIFFSFIFENISLKTNLGQVLAPVRSNILYHTRFSLVFVIVIRLTCNLYAISLKKQRGTFCGNAIKLFILFI